MKPFAYERPADAAAAIALAARTQGAQFISGGTSQVDLLKEGVQEPDMLIDISRLPLTEIGETASGGLRVEANVDNSAAADDARIGSRYTAISEAIHAGASHQVRNMASFAGNLLQRTRCPYLRDPAQACNKREPGRGCAAVSGYNRMHAIFGQVDAGGESGETCIAVHPSDLAVALAAHEAVVHVEGPEGPRELPFDRLHQLSGAAPNLDATLAKDELIVAIELPPFRGRSHYLKARDRASYAYALVSCAVALEMDGERILAARIALGSVAYKPWRATAAEQAIEGELADAELFEHAASLALEGARPYAMNAYKLPLGRAMVRRALAQTAGLEPMPGPPGTALAANVGGLAGPLGETA